MPLRIWNAGGGSVVIATPHAICIIEKQFYYFPEVLEDDVCLPAIEKEDERKTRQCGANYCSPGGVEELVERMTETVLRIW